MSYLLWISNDSGPSINTLAAPICQRLIFTSRSYTAMVKSYVLQQNFITPYSPEKNGMIERVIRTLKKKCLTVTYSIACITQSGLLTIGLASITTDTRISH
jgi:transposase InsO family protein